MIHIRRLRWENWNIAHIARHGVTPEEVEEVCHGDFFLLQGTKRRIILIGPTDAGQILAVVLEHEGEGNYYPVTARPASRKERSWYQDMQKKV